MKLTVLAVGRLRPPFVDDAGHLLVVHLVVDPRERDRELVVGVADVGEVRVDAGHDVRREVDVDVAPARGVWISSHVRVASHM